MGGELQKNLSARVERGRFFLWRVGLEGAAVLVCIDRAGIRHSTFLGPAARWSRNRDGAAIGWVFRLSQASNEKIKRKK